MNCVYAVVTFLKVFDVVPRLPNETHYLFKHCLLSMADAFFCQVPVHKFYVAQAVDALLRCVVWRRYHVLPGAPMPVVVLVSVAWQAWIIVLGCMLQARHVTSYLRRRLQPQRVPPAEVRAEALSQGLTNATAAAASAASTAAAAGGSESGTLGVGLPRPPSPTSGLAAATPQEQAQTQEQQHQEQQRQQQQQRKQQQVQQQQPSMLLQPPPDQQAQPASQPEQQQRQQQETQQEHQEQQQPVRPYVRRVITRPLGAMPDFALITATTTTNTTTTLNGSDAAPETFSPGALQTADLLLSRSSSTSTRTRSALSSAARLGYRVIAPGGVGVGGASAEEEPQLWSGEEGWSVGATMDGDGGCNTGGGALRHFVFTEVEQEAGRQRERSAESDEDDFCAPIPMLSMVDAAVDGSSERGDSLTSRLALGEDAVEACSWCCPARVAPSNRDVLGRPAAALAADTAAVTMSGTAAVLCAPSELGSAAPSPAAAIAAGAAARPPSAAPSAAELASLLAGGFGGRGGSRRSREAEAALQRLVRGPSSYVLLSKQRERDNARTKAGVQLVVGSASPDKLAATAHWRDKLAAALAESAPGWHLASVSVRKGSLIVHMDLVYEPAVVTAGAAGADAPATAGAGTAPAPGASGPAAAAAVASTAAATPPPRPRPPVSAALEQFLLDMGPAGVLDALSLPDHAPASCADYISIQYGDRMLRYNASGSPCSALAGSGEIQPAPLAELSPAAGLAVSASPRGEAATQLRQRRHVRGGGGRQAAAAMAGGPEPGLREGAAVPGMQGAWRGQAALRRLHASARLHAAALRETLLLALRPPSLVASREYDAFLHGRVAPLHMLYANTMAVTTLIFYSAHRGAGLRLTNILCFMAPELLSLVVRPVFRRGGGCSDGSWSVVMRAPLVYVGLVIRGFHAIATCLGVVPCVAPQAAVSSHPLSKDEIVVLCTEMRWIMKMMIVSALQVICMQTPVRLTFLVRLVTLVGSLLAHLVLCNPGSSALGSLALHLGWEAGLLVLAASMQARHIQAYRLSRLSLEAAAAASLPSSASLSPAPSCCSFADIRGGGGSGNAKTGGDDFSGSPKSLSMSPWSLSVAATAAAAAATENSTNESGVASAALSLLSGAPGDKNPSTPTSHTGGSNSGGDDAVGDASKSLELLWSSAGKWEGVRPSVSGGRAGSGGDDDDGGSCGCGVGADPWDIALSSSVLSVAPRRSSVLHVRFTCTARVVEELQVVLRHVSPASMASGVHSAGPAAVITRTLAPPAAAHLQQPHGSALRFDAELTMVAALQDTPGIVHVELWRGRRRLAGRPVLLTASAAPDGRGVGSLQPDGGVHSRDVASGLLAAAATDTAVASEEDVAPWLRDVEAYVGTVAAEGHAPAADQFVEELGGWMAQVAALQRGLISGHDGSGTHTAGAGAAHRIARVLRVNSASWLPPPAGPLPWSGSAVDRQRPAPPPLEAVAGAPESPPQPLDPASAAVRQLLVCQGQGLLAVVVEAGCVALSEHLLAQLQGPLGADPVAVAEAAVTPVTGLPLMHAAVKSGCTQMVDLVAAWLARVGAIDIWSREAVVRAVSLEPCGLHGCALSHGSPAVTHLASPSLVDPAHLAAATTAATTLPPPGLPPLVVLAGHGIAADSTAVTVEEGGAEAVKAASAVRVQGRSSRGRLLESRGSHESDDVSLTGSFLLETNRRDPPPSFNNMLPTPPSSSTPVLPRARLLSIPAAAASEAASASALPPPPPPRPHGTASRNRLEPAAAGNNFTSAAAAILATSYTSTGVSVAAALAAAELAPPPGQQPAGGLSATFKVVCLRPETAGATSVVQVLPRDACRSKEPLAAACGGQPPHVMSDGGLPLGVSEPSASAARPHTCALLTAPPPPTAKAAQARLRRTSAATDAAQPRSSLDSPWLLVDGGILLLTPVHVALALADEGRVAAHIFSKYHEAHELWHTNQGHWLSTGASNAGLDSSMASPFETPDSLNLGGPGGSCSSYAGFAGALVPSSISLRRSSSAANANAASALMAMQSHASQARYRMSGIGGWGGSGTATQVGGGGGGERITPRGSLQVSGRGLSGCDGAGGQGYGGGASVGVGAGGSVLLPLERPLGAIDDVEPKEEAVRSLSLEKVAFLKGLC